MLQAQTARSQAELQLQTLEGQLQMTRGALAVAMGLPANTPFDVPDVPAADSVHFIAQSVDTLIELAVQSRPELAAARAQAAAAQSQIRVARSALPSGARRSRATGGNTRSNVSSFSGQHVQLELRAFQVPVFSGFSNHYDVAAASEQYQAALARTETTKQQVIQQVFNAYYSSARRRTSVRTSRDLLASATQSEEVARERYREGVGTHRRSAHRAERAGHCARAGDRRTMAVADGTGTARPRRRRTQRARRHDVFATHAGSRREA